MTRRWIVSAVAAMVAGPLAAVLLVGAPFATAGPASASKAPLAIVEHASKFSADARAAIASEADAVVPKLTAAGAGYMRTGLAPELPKGTELVGAVSASTPVEVDLALVPRDPQALAQFATAVSTPGTSEFRHYITTSEFGQRYGASPSAIDAVRSAMTAAGLTANAASANGLEVKVTGTAAQFEQAFSTTLNSYRLASGRVGISNTLAPRIASSAAKYVSAVIGLNTLLQLTPLDAGPSKSVGRSALQAGRPQAVKPAVASAATVSPWSATASTYANGPTPCPAASAYAASETESEVPDTPITGDLGVNNTLYTYNAYSTAYDFDPLYRAGDLGQGVNVGIFELEANYPTDPTIFDLWYGF
jgi:subtilase family serine protease